MFLVCSSRILCFVSFQSVINNMISNLYRARYLIIKEIQEHQGRYFLEVTMVLVHPLSFMDQFSVMVLMSLLKQGTWLYSVMINWKPRVYVLYYRAYLLSSYFLNV